MSPAASDCHRNQRRLSPNVRTTFLLNLMVVATITTIPYCCNGLSLYKTSPIHRVAVVGGTHGNEYTGVWCIRTIEAQQKELKAQYPSLDIQTILGNEEAHLENKRFIDTDLNREFKCDTLCGVDGDDVVVMEEEEEEEPASREARRAKELDALLGSKCDSDNGSEIDVAIDLHSTTANMGLTLIINEGDELMTQGAAYVVGKCPGAHILMHSIPEREDRPTLSSAAKHGFTIEVGPIPQGLLRHDTVLKTESAMHALLEFFQRKNDGVDVQAELKETYPDGHVPCYRSAPARRDGEISGKITWPCDPVNPNFPALMIHESVQDKDFSLIKVGDPLFVAHDRSVVPYDGSHGDEVYLIFVNEAGYYYASSGTGIGVAITSYYDLQTGMLKEEKENACYTPLP
ncbi:unnamed protein product [Cylindrotheca closterium]|uniref:Aspartoacylase n=1 Tax=Cylindrotheca closterium TaxID=2856 RepID=A0AAD2G4Z1_9STRA|nr:unnamed protein product [Cylindrotheca closterium]